MMSSFVGGTKLVKSFSIHETSWYIQAQEHSVLKDICHKGSCW